MKIDSHRLVVVEREKSVIVSQITRSSHKKWMSGSAVAPSPQHHASPLWALFHCSLSPDNRSKKPPFQRTVYVSEAGVNDIPSLMWMICIFEHVSLIQEDTIRTRIATQGLQDRIRDWGISVCSAKTTHLQVAANCPCRVEMNPKAT
jgi:hypothetical protein